MKRFVLVLAPLVALPFLTNCGGIKKFTVSFDSAGGTPVDSQKIAVNECAVKPANPSKDTAEATYTFVYWELDNNEFDFSTPITKDINLIAKWNKGSTKKYPITWKMDDDTTLRTDQVEYDKMPVYGDSPTKESTAQYDYTFIGWDHALTKVTGPATYKACFSSTIRSYDIQWEDGDGKIIQTDRLNYGATPTYKGPEPTKAPSTYHNYKFIGWNPDITPVTGPKKYVAQFSEFPKEYTVSVVSEDESKGNVDGGGSYPYNSNVKIYANPNTGYVFYGWYDGKTLVSSDSTYSFTMPAKNITYTAKFVNKNAWFIKTDWWNYCSNGISGEQATKEDIGKEVDLLVNNQIHKVRLIDVDHDDLYETSGKAHCSFEFVNLLSDSDGYSLATFWYIIKGTPTNYDYLNSDLRKALDGQGSGVLRWYQKESSTKSTTYNTSVIEMLPDGLLNKLKTVKKYVATSSSYTVNNYGVKVFVLTNKEMTAKDESYAQEGTTYKYYIDNDSDSYRVKHQIKWHEGAVASSTRISDEDETSNKRNYAGFNSTENKYGGYYWLTSPDSQHYNNAWRINSSGAFVKENTDYGAFAIAPAFCV